MTKSKMKWTFVCLSCLIPFSNSFTSFAGSYCAVLTRVNNRPEMNRDLADWHTGITKLNRDESAMYGRFEIKKPIVKPMVHWDTYKFSNGKWDKFKLDRLSKNVTICKESFKKSYYDPHFFGTSKWIFPECIMTKGYMNISVENAISVDAITHELMPYSCPYGTFKIFTNVTDENLVVFGGLELEIEVRPRNSGKCDVNDVKKEENKPTQGKGKKGSHKNKNK